MTDGLTGQICELVRRTAPGRTIGPDVPLETATAALKQAGRRRLAVVDESGRLIGLLCLKRRSEGFCSNDNVTERAEEFGRPTPSRLLPAPVTLNV